MFYEEKVINGKLCSRTTPKGTWQELTSARALALNALLALSAQDRESVLSYL